MKPLRSLQKYERMYPYGWSWRTRVVNNTVCHFVASNLMFEIFLKRGNIRKRVRWNRGLKHLFTLCIAVSREFHAKLVCFLFFLVIKRILKALFSLIPLLLNSSDLPSYGSNLRKRYTLTLLSICLGRSTHSLLHTPSIPSSIFLP